MWSLDLCWPVNGCAHQHLQHLHNSCWCVNKSTTIVPKNIELTLVLTDRINGTTWLAEKVTSSSLTGLEVLERRHTTVRMLFYLRKRPEEWPWKQAKNKLITMLGCIIHLKRFLVEAFWARKRIPSLPSLSGLALLPNWTRADCTGLPALQRESSDPSSLYPDLLPPAGDLEICSPPQQDTTRLPSLWHSDSLYATIHGR